MHVNQVEMKCENYAWKKWMKKNYKKRQRSKKRQQNYFEAE